MPSPDPDPTSATGAKFTLNPSCFMAAACSPACWAASSGVPSATVAAEGISPSASRSRWTVPPSSSAPTIGVIGAPSTASAIWDPTSLVWLPLSPNPPTWPAASELGFFNRNVCGSKKRTGA